MLGVATPSPLYTDETKSLSLSDGWRHAIVVHAIFDKILLGHRELPVVIATMSRQLDFNSRDDAMC